MLKQLILMVVFLAARWPCLCAASRGGLEMEDFSSAVIVTAKQPGPVERKAVQVLKEEIEKRTGVILPLVAAWPADGTPAIAVGTFDHVRDFAGPFAAAIESAAPPKPEGFTLSLEHQSHAVLVCGSDERGVLYGVGRLLRKMELRAKSTRIPAGLRIVTAPKF